METRTTTSPAGCKKCKVTELTTGDQIGTHIELCDECARKSVAPAHTPGPWIHSPLDPKFDDVAAFRIDGNHMYESVADVFYREDGEQEANARLIAAAPELLTACIEAANLLSDMDDDESEPVFRLLTDAINKAEGR